MTSASRLLRALGAVVATGTLALGAVGSMAQTAAPTPQAAPRGDGHEPPPQAYADCRGKKSGERVKHATPDGVVDAECMESPKGLVARPIRSAAAGAGAGSAPKR